MVQSVITWDGEDGVSKFPGPVTLFSSRKKWGRLAFICGVFTGVGIAMIFNAAPLSGFFVTASCGVGTIISLMMLMPSGSSLRLDGSGFETTKFFFVRQRYRWCEVSDFVVWGAMIGQDMVVFKAEKPHLRASERINAALAGGRNGYLPDTYGKAAVDLAQLMTSWRDLAINATK